jgi:hypothetical protein
MSTCGIAHSDSSEELKRVLLLFDMDMSYTRVLHIKVAYRVPHK